MDERVDWRSHGVCAACLGPPVAACEPFRQAGLLGSKHQLCGEEYELVGVLGFLAPEHNGVCPEKRKRGSGFLEPEQKKPLADRSSDSPKVGRKRGRCDDLNERRKRFDDSLRKLHELMESWDDFLSLKGGVRRKGSLHE